MSNVTFIQVKSGETGAFLCCPELDYLRFGPRITEVLFHRYCYGRNSGETMTD